jgi:hypothetical protein
MRRPVPPFRLGRLLITRHALETLDATDIATALARHVRGDWGDVCTEDWEDNDLSVTDDRRVLSSYTDRNKTGFWIITEADRSATTVLLPDGAP